MSKKSKRLEKENQNLTRKHELTSKNILQMAEDRTKANKEMEMLRKKNINLEKLCRGMQQQGRGQIPPPVEQPPIEMDSEGTGSEYDYEDEEDDEEDASDDPEYEDFEEEEPSSDRREGEPPTSDPTSAPPPPPPPLETSPGHSGINGKVNGVKH